MVTNTISVDFSKKQTFLPKPGVSDINLLKNNNSTSVAEIFIFKTLIFTSNTDKEIIEKILFQLSEEDFSSYEFKNLYRAICKCYEEIQSIELVELFKIIEKNKEEYFGVNVELFKMLSESVFTIADINLDLNIKHIKEAGRKRRMFEFIQSMQNKTDTAENIAVNIIDYVKKNILNNRLNKDKADNSYTVTEILKDTIDSYVNNTENNNSIMTGFGKIDNLIMGFRKGDYVILAGRPGLGKTAFAMTCAMNQAKTHNVIFYSCEMSEGSLGERILSMITGVNIKELRREGIKKDHLEILETEKENIKSMNIQFVFNLKNIEDIQADLYQRIHQFNADIIYVDYLQLLTTKQKFAINNRNLEISQISQKLKNMATDLKIAVVALSQLNRDIDRENRLPRLSDLRDSGSIEADADLICFLHKIKDKNSITITAETDFIVAKGRNVGIGGTKLYWSSDFMKFID